MTETTPVTESGTITTGDQKSISAAMLAQRCRAFMDGAKQIYNAQGARADLWFFALYHHLDQCADALEGRRSPDTNSPSNGS